MPRGAIHPMKPHSPTVRSEPQAEAYAMSGRTRRTSTAIRIKEGTSTGTTDAGVTAEEMEMNSSPMIICTSVSRKGLRAGMSRPGRLVMASPVKMAAMSPVSSRAMSQPAETRITVANWARVPSVSPSRNLCSVSQRMTVPTAPPTRPTPTLIRNCPIWYPRPRSTR